MIDLMDEKEKNGAASKLISGLNAQVICFQETHWTDDLMSRIKKVWEEDIQVLVI